MSNDGHLTSPKTPSDTDSNSNSGSLFSRRYPDESSSDSNGSKENTPLLSNNENSLSSKLLSHTAETVSTVRRRLFKDFFPEILKCQPKITCGDTIDLATNEEKSNSDDEWFKQKIKPRGESNRSKKFGNSQASLGNTHADVQKCLMKRLTKLRRNDQQKRKAMYDADNGIVFDGSESMEIDVHGLMDNEENKTSEWNSGEKTQENNASLKGEDEEPKCDLIEHETAGSNHHNKETFSQKNEINGRQINIENKNNEAKQKVKKENENIELKEVENGDVTGNSDNKFVPETFEDTSDEDWRKNWLQSGMKTDQSLVERKDSASCYLPNNETDSSNLSDETTDSEEDDGSSATLVDELLSDVAENCSGIFEYPEDSESEEHNKLAEKWVSMDDSGDGRGDEYTDELIRQHRKPRKRRLVFSPDNSDEDERKECGGAPKAVKNVQNLEADDREDTNVCSTSDHKKKSSNNVNAVLNESEKFKANDKDSLLFDDEDDSHNRDVIQPTDEANGDESQRTEEVEGTGSSDDELEVFRKLQIAQKRKKRSEYIEEEASLSGDDVGSDENDDEDQLNIYEAEEGDNDELPDDETIREQLQKQWLKQQQDEEDRKLLYWKDQLLVNGDLADETDRTFRFKLRLSKRKNADEEIDDVTVGAENFEVDDDELCKRRREISKWKVEERKDELRVGSISVKGTNPLLKAASKVIGEGNLNENNQSREKIDASLCKNSLLRHRRSLSQVLNHTKIALYTKSAGTHNTHTDGRTEEQNAIKDLSQETVNKSGSVEIQRYSHTSL